MQSHKPAHGFGGFDSIIYAAIGGAIISALMFTGDLKGYSIIGGLIVGIVIGIIFAFKAK